MENCLNLHQIKINNDLEENKIKELISGNENIEADTKKETNKNLNNHY